MEKLFKITKPSLIYAASKWDRLKKDIYVVVKAKRYVNIVHLLTPIKTESNLDCQIHRQDRYHCAVIKILTWNQDDPCYA